MPVRRPAHFADGLIRSSHAKANEIKFALRSVSPHSFVVAKPHLVESQRMCRAKPCDLGRFETDNWGNNHINCEDSLSLYRQVVVGTRCERAPMYSVMLRPNVLSAKRLKSAPNVFLTSFQQSLTARFCA